MQTDFRDFRSTLQLADEKPAAIAEVKKAWLSAGCCENHSSRPRLRKLWAWL